jgi:hypothetical protein
MDEKKEFIKRCVVKQIQESSSNASIASLDDRINKLINDSQDMLVGGRKIHKRNGTIKRKRNETIKRKRNGTIKRKRNRKTMKRRN